MVPRTLRELRGASPALSHLMTYHCTSLFGHLLGARVTPADTAATALYVLGLSLPPDADGQPVHEAFDVSATPTP